MGDPAHRSVALVLNNYDYIWFVPLKIREITTSLLCTPLLVETPGGNLGIPHKKPFSKTSGDGDRI